MSDSRTRIWFALFVLAVFCAGLASGVLIGRRMGPPLRGEFAGGRPPSGPRGAVPLVERLSRELDLNADQRSRVEVIFAERRPRLEQLQREALDRAEQERREMHAAIRQLLTPDQQRKFDRWLEEQPRGRGFGRRGRGGPRP